MLFGKTKCTNVACRCGLQDSGGRVRISHVVSRAASHDLAHRYCVSKKAAERSRMQTPDVINLEERVDDKLLIGGASNRVLTIEAMMRKPDRIEIPF